MRLSEQDEVIAGRYALESLIGEGGMASVWRARDLTLERAVAVKLLFARDERDQQRLVQQFVREARIAASVHHRNVIQIVDFGTTDREQPFMVMELLEGETLGQRLNRERKLSIAETLHISALTLRGLAAVHDAGIIHRDLKPDNIFLTHDSGGALFPKILDFGISRSIEPRSGRRSALTTREGMIVGTPEYMSPEQARGVRDIDRRSDIYSMGAILYQALTGRLAFASENVGDMIIQIVTGTLEPVHALAPEVPRALSDVIAKAMARAPDDRFRDAPSMQRALLAAAHNELDVRERLTLSDAPPPIGALPDPPRPSGDQLRTLEFASEEPADEPSVRARDSGSTLSDDEVRSSWRARARRHARALAWIAVASGVCVSAFFLLTRDRSSRAAREPAASASIGVALPSASIAAAPEPSTITVALRNVPKGAIVSVDGKRAAGDHFELARDGQDRVIEVSAPGKIPWQVVHHASADASFDVTLVDRAAQAANIPHGTHSLELARSSGANTKKAHKRPPSALRRLDF